MRLNRLNIVSIFAIALLAFAQPGFAQENVPPASPQEPPTTDSTAPPVTPTNWRTERLALEPAFQQELAAIATWCRENGLEKEAVATLDWSWDRDPNRQYIFLPKETPISPPRPPDTKPAEPVDVWQTKLIAARRVHAIRIFELAKKAAAAEAGAFAFQCLHESLHYDPDLEAVRTILGHKKRDDHWQVASGRLRSKQATKTHPQINWPKKSYLVVSSDHFEIASRASEEETLFLAESLEKWHLVWRQVFFEFWNRPTTVERWINGKGQQRKSSRKFRIVFFKDRNQYIEELAPHVPGIEVSSGYYNDSDDCSFFYASHDSEIHDTWRHEATHQWFSESIRTPKPPFENTHVWLGEGVAMYFESITDFGDYVTIGGLDSRRLQYARVRTLRDEYFIPLAELIDIGRSQLQKREDIRKLYSQSAGLTHFLMNAQSGKYEQALIGFLRLLYQGKLKPDSFEKFVGISIADLEREYRNYLKPSSQQVQSFLLQPESRTELAFPTIQLDVGALNTIGRCAELQWLDLSTTSIDHARLNALRGCAKLEQLFLTGCRIEPGALAALAPLANLHELDLSGSNITDDGLQPLTSFNALHTLRIISTHITDAGLQTIAQIPNLKVLDLGQTPVSPAAVSRLKKTRPKLEIIQ